MTPDHTLVEAKKHLRANWERGVECPCCGQFVKLYKRKLTSAMAYVLILMSRRSGTDYFHVENWLKTENTPASLRGDFPKLRYWGLIEAQAGKRSDGSSRLGFYRITQAGRDFVAGNSTIPSHAHLFNQKFLGLTGDLIDIRTALESKFSYDELMGHDALR